MFRSNPPEVLSKKDAVKIRRKPTREQRRVSTISRTPLYNFIEIMPTHICAPRMQGRSTEHLSIGEQFWETVPVCQESFEGHKLYKVSIYSC